MVRGVWSLGGSTKTGRRYLFPVKREYQYFLNKTMIRRMKDEAGYLSAHLYTQPSMKLKRMRRSATPAVAPIPM